MTTTQITTKHGIVHDVTLHVEDTGGDGRAVVLVHGWPLSGASWSEQVPALVAAGYRVITYDRRGFGESDKPKTGYGYDSLTHDLREIIKHLGLHDVTLVGFSMGGGEVARYFSEFGTEDIHSVVFASAVPPFLARIPGNPDGPLELTQAAQMAAGLTADEAKFYDGFITQFLTAGDTLTVSEAQRQTVLALTKQADKLAALECMTSFGNTDFREDLEKVTVPTLVIHGDSDGVVPFEGSGKRTHEAIAGSELHVVAGGPHGINVSHAEEFNRVLIEFLGR